MAMTVHLRLFATARERAGRSEMDLSLPPTATVADATKDLLGQIPKLLDVLARCAFAVNLETVGEGHALRDGDELAILPPVSGG